MIPRPFLPIFAAVAAIAAPLAPILKIPNIGDIVTDNFHVVMKPMSDSDFLSFLSSREADVISDTVSTFNIGSFKGFHGVFSQSLLDSILSLTQVKYIEPVTRVTTSVLSTQNSAPWGLGRISHKKPGSMSYIYDSSAGRGTYAYVIDTGVYAQHVDFEGRATFGANFAGDGQDFDGNGQGTHVSGTIGSKTYGVAKKTQIIGVKVLDASGSGSSAGVISGIQWAVNDAKGKKRIGKAVANTSLGGTFSQASNDAVAAAQEMMEDLQQLHLLRAKKTACTVGATDKTDARASYSNYGSVVDIFAPGTDIISTWIRSNTDTNTISGTSMATPHIVGLGAYLLGLEGARQPIPLCERIRTLATKNALSGVNSGLGVLLGRNT